MARLSRGRAALERLRAAPTWVSVWHVEYSDETQMCDISIRKSYEEAVDRMRTVMVLGFSCVRITGPHQHRVPARKP